MKDETAEIIFGYLMFLSLPLTLFPMIIYAYAHGGKVIAEANVG